jgi:DNA-binding MarR family transcriptional regulator
VSTEPVRRLALADAEADAETDAEIDAEIDVTRLRVALARLSRRLRRHELAGLTPTQLAALSTIGKTGPMRLGDLAAAEGIAPSTLTRLVTALEEAGHVRRTADPSDARASTLAITAHGQDALERIRAENTLMLTASLELLTPEQRSVLAAALPVLEQLAETTPGSRLSRYRFIATRPAAVRPGGGPVRRVRRSYRRAAVPAR